MTRLKTVFLLLSLVVAIIMMAPPDATSQATLPQCTMTGQAYLYTSPFLTQFYGCAGGGSTKVEILGQGYVGVIRIHAAQIRLDGEVVYGGYLLKIGEPDSAGPGQRLLTLSNEPVHNPLDEIANPEWQQIYNRQWKY